MLSIPPNELGPNDTDRLRQMAYWCEVVMWLGDHYAADYLAGDLRTRLAIHQALCLLADIARQTDPTTLAAMPGSDWRGLIRMRVLLAHIPWRVRWERVWYAVTVSVPALYAELQRYRGAERK